ncbi:hypothetical protein [Streptomyces sp. NPDC091371]|uniref:hypothetical protein n=1 Tax=Streptomyces sp. NPDC091371 TaxID=3155303 RepID=UPI00342D3A7C
MSLVELIARADERALAASAVACVDRCMPLLEGVEGLGLDVDESVLRPLWVAVEGGDRWLGRLRAAGIRVRRVTPDCELAEYAMRLVEHIPATYCADALRAWADECSTVLLGIHQLLDGAPAVDEARIQAYRAGDTEGVRPLTLGEQRRQAALLEMLADESGSGLRGALALSNEGKRVLRAAVSRRNRTIGASADTQG